MSVPGRIKSIQYLVFKGISVNVKDKFAKIHNRNREKSIDTNSKDERKPDFLKIFE